MGLGYYLMLRSTIENGVQGLPCNSAALFPKLFRQSFECAVPCWPKLKSKASFALLTFAARVTSVIITRRARN